MISKLLENLYIGNAEDAQLYDALAKLGINTIVTVGYGVRISPPKNFLYFYFPLLDESRFCDTLVEQQQTSLYKNAVDTVIRQLGSPGKKVLVHCAAGMSRSAIVCIGAIKCLNKISWQEAEKIVRGRHPPAALLNFPLLIFHRRHYECRSG